MQKLYLLFISDSLGLQIIVYYSERNASIYWWPEWLFLGCQMFYCPISNQCGQYLFSFALWSPFTCIEHGLQRKKAIVGKNVDLSTKHLSKSNWTFIIWVKILRGKEETGSLMSVLLPGLVLGHACSSLESGPSCLFSKPSSFHTCKGFDSLGGGGADV